MVSDRSRTAMNSARVDDLGTADNCSPWRAMIREDEQMEHRRYVFRDCRKNSG